MNSKLIFSGIIIAGLIIAGAIIYTNDDSVNSQKASLEEATKDEIKEGSNIKGNPEASISIVEFSDFECSYCAKFNQTMDQIMKDYPNNIKWSYRHFPLSGHKDARSAAEASECAAEQGKFWEFHDGLFENQSRLGEGLYLELAQKLELDPDLFKECFESRKHKDKVEEDYQAGIKAGVKGTPGNFINGQPLGGAVPYEVIKKAIESVLNN
ncbi:MAG: DsbA family protein [Candidatus Portnoybacteria bacterium]